MSAVCAGAPAATSIRAARTAVRIIAASHTHDLTGALLEIGLERNRVGGVERNLVDELACVEPRHEHKPARHEIASARFDARHHLAATGDDLDLAAASQLELA